MQSDTTETDCQPPPCSDCERKDHLLIVADRIAPAPNRAPAPSPDLPAEGPACKEDEDAEIETMHSDCPTDDLKPAADITVTKHTTDQLECDDEEEEEDDDAGPGNGVPTQCTEHKVPKNTKPNSLCRYIVDHLAHNSAPTLASTTQHIETWIAVLQNEDILLTSLGKMSRPSAPHPVFFLALDSATSAALLLHHFGIVSTGAHQRGEGGGALCRPLHGSRRRGHPSSGGARVSRRPVPPRDLQQAPDRNRGRRPHGRG
jgi:hypothetical protein